MTIAIAARLPLRQEYAHSVRIATLLAAVLLLNAFDLAYSLFAQRAGLLHESNPLADAFLRAGLIPSFIAFKILLVSAGCLMIWKLRASPWSAPACWTLILAYTALGIVWYLWVKDVNFTLEVQLSVTNTHSAMFIQQNP